jgi:hypothetical protein
MQSIPPLGAWGTLFSGKVVEAQPWQSKLFQQSLLYILSLNQRDLFRFHFAPILRELAIDFAADTEHLVFSGVLCERGLEFFVENGQTALEILKVEVPAGFDQRQDRYERVNEFGQPTCQLMI